MLARLARATAMSSARAASRQPRDVGGDELDLGALAAALEQHQRVARVGTPARRRLEQRALERVQGGALVVLGERRQLDVLRAERHELLEGLAAPGERRAPGS